MLNELMVDADKLVLCWQESLGFGESFDTNISK